MKKRKLRINVVVFFIAFMLIGEISNAQRGRHYGGRKDYGRGYGKHSMHHGLSDQLDLSDEQKEKIEEIKLALSKESIQRQNKLREMEAQLTTSLTQDNVDKSKLNNLIDEIGKLKTESRKDRVEVQLKIRDLLTEKQKIIFDQHKSKRSGKRGHKYYNNKI